uniref:urophorphyrin III methylase n=1 Tax=Galdieria phlegrea TaxID=1389228 RepID=UPI0023D81130|nr:urophorphyrin III methylase [Galdieria phlegrea]WDA99830.1 urophorphyrin III methylase [Galdieria phlegrea]
MKIINRKRQVYLIGAGPGKDDLISIIGNKILKTADVIIYDSLVNPKILHNNYKFNNKSIKYIKVKKKRDYQSLGQISIIKLILYYNQKNLCVIRLKSGDPLLFARGGEELVELLGHDVKVQVIPGITSGISAYSYNGIPLSHRKWNSSITLISGELASSNNINEINWQNIIIGSASLIIYMGVHNLCFIIDNCKRYGKNNEIPIALIRWNTWKQQEELIGTIGTILTQIYDNNFGPPAIILIGPMVELRAIIKAKYKRFK